MELIINTFSTSLSRDNEGFTISNSDGKQRILVHGIKSIQISRGALYLEWVVFAFNDQSFLPI